uniref:START domain-containing protein n=1 Tax=Panagrellus redivivus TaxID=6233 RepID=A0A7E4VFN2_PANRE
MMRAVDSPRHVDRDASVCSRRRTCLVWGPRPRVSYRREGLSRQEHPRATRVRIAHTCGLQSVAGCCVDLLLPEDCLGRRLDCTDRSRRRDTIGLSLANKVMLPARRLIEPLLRDFRRQRRTIQSA